ncbi:Gp19/Gp15/Gp42 family protein [Mycobacteroides abscessus]|uniref:Gp19/Gp15/Gp42 family protein n=1 Tax=Mycobacteroides abscessus TaxID=36809 RepID=UPI0018968AF9
MTTPAAPAKFAAVSDVTSRFEGTFPSDREAWVQLRIEDVESELMARVPSLRASVSEIADERRRRVTALVADKVLELYRNPDGASQVSQTMEQDTMSRSYSRDAYRGKIAFTADELASVGLKKRRPKIGTMTAAPWMP